MVKKKLLDSQIRAIQKKWAQGGPGVTQASLAEKYDVSPATIKRVVSGIRKGTKTAAIAVQQAKAQSEAADPVVAQAEVVSTDGQSPTGVVKPERFQEFLETAIGKMLMEANATGCKSGGEASFAASRLLETWRSLYPMTMQEAARWVVKIPGFNPKEFARCLITEWESQR